ncbi:MAG: type II toxin-antitoxin system HicA family toxin [Sphaerochaeta sp.]|nr:type II toxin-antitoxin system HicA family toxin [Sphaerochaeta sp.]
MPSKLHKLIAKMKSQPANIRFEDLSYVLTHCGCEQNAGKGSHYIYYNPITKKRLTVPKHKPVKACYIRQAFELFDLEEVLHDED